MVVMTAQLKSFGRRSKAPAMALRTVGSPPIIRSWAPETRAARKKTEMKASANASAAIATIVPPLTCCDADSPFSEMASQSWVSATGIRIAAATIPATMAEITGSQMSSRSCLSTAQLCFIKSTLRRMVFMSCPS